MRKIKNKCTYAPEMLTLLWFLHVIFYFDLRFERGRGYRTSGALRCVNSCLSSRLKFSRSHGLSVAVVSVLCVMRLKKIEHSIVRLVVYMNEIALRVGWLKGRPCFSVSVNVKETRRLYRSHFRKM